MSGGLMFQWVLSLLLLFKVSEKGNTFDSILLLIHPCGFHWGQLLTTYSSNSTN